MSDLRARLDHDQLAVLAREYLLAGHLIDRAGMPLVLALGLDVMRDVAIEEWMGASPVYTKRMQRLLGFETGNVEAALKGMQLDIGAPPEFMDFRMEVHDDHHGSFHLAHCGALMDVEPLGDDFVLTMCHHIEDPTFDATGWATDPRLRMRPVHRPPRSPADRLPHCEWTVTIDPTAEPTPTPARSLLIGATNAARLPLAAVAGETTDGHADYSRPLDADLRMEDFASPTLRALLDEVALQAHLLVLSFASALAERTEAAFVRDTVARQFTGVAGVAAGRLVDAFALDTDAEALGTVFDLHPAFRPRSYVGWSVDVDGDVVQLELDECPGTAEPDHTSWITSLRDGDHRALQAIATAVDPYWTVAHDGLRRWTVTRGREAVRESRDVGLVKVSTGSSFSFRR